MSDPQFGELCFDLRESLFILDLPLLAIGLPDTTFVHCASILDPTTMKAARK